MAQILNFKSPDEKYKEFMIEKINAGSDNGETILTIFEDEISLRVACCNVCLAEDLDHVIAMLEKTKFLLMQEHL